MKLAIGGKFNGNEEILKTDSVKFVADDGNTMFEVTAGKDGRSIEVRGVECCKVGKVMYCGYLEVRPNVANSITVLARKYED